MSLLRLAVECPRCKRPPNRRIFPRTREKHLQDLPDEPVDTHSCTGCGEVYVIPARAYQEAA